MMAETFCKESLVDDDDGDTRMVMQGVSKGVWIDPFCWGRYLFLVMGSNHSGKRFERQLPKKWVSMVTGDFGGIGDAEVNSGML